MEIDFKINDFSGPLDLLLHLIKENKMDIMDIEIEKITKQYVDYINKQEQMNLDVSSEYLVMAAELVEIKSKLLLPKPVKEEDDNFEEDPRERLVNKLLEYQAYKEITKVLQEKENIRKDIYTKLPEDIHNYVDSSNEIVSDVSLDDLVDAFKKYLIRKKENKPLKTKVTTNEMSVASRRVEIKSYLKKKGKVNFFELFPIVTREYIVVTFLAVLEMAKSKELRIIQDGIFQDIICEVVNNE